MDSIMIGPGNDEEMSDINVTPFVDVLLVLLVIFMITAPIINQTVQVDLPEDSYSKDGASLDNSLKVIIDKEGIIYVNNDQIGFGLEKENLTKFEQRIKEWTANKLGPQSVDLEADKEAKYASIIPVITQLKEMGLNLNLIIEPPE